MTARSSHLHGNRLKRPWPALLLWLACMLPPVLPDAAEQQIMPVSEAQVKAHIVLNFPLVVGWPSPVREPEQKVLVCTIGDDGVVRYLKQAARSEPSDQFLFRADVPLEYAKHCHVLVIGTRDKKEIQAVMVALGDAPVLTVGSARNFAGEGGIIGFLENEKQIGLFSEKQVKFEINLRRAQAVGLVLDPLLLELADRIISKEAP